MASDILSNIELKKENCSGAALDLGTYSPTLQELARHFPIETKF